jgi:prepilin-type N-terminal cleavage/methylation domain-containing protein
MHHPTVTHCYRTSRIRSGFTLIEISIVLVIVGLIIGGVLLGRDLIRSAAVRAGTSQITQYNTEVRTFQLKFNGMPGDLTPQQAASFGFLVLQGGDTCGDGDGYVMSFGSGATGLCPTVGSDSVKQNGNNAQGEILAFWRHLTDAHLIDGTYGSDLMDWGGIDLANPAPVTSNYLPPSKLGNGLSVLVFSNGGSNFFGIIPFALNTKNKGWYRYSLIPQAGLSPIEAYNLDVKMDDGLPNTGTVLATTVAYYPIGQWGSGSTPNQSVYGIYPPTLATTATSNTCTMGVSPVLTPITGVMSNIPAYNANTYNLDGNNGGSDLSCSLTLKFQ